MSEAISWFRSIEWTQNFLQYFWKKVPVRSPCLRTQIWWFSGFLFWVPEFQALSLHVSFYYIKPLSPAPMGAYEVPDGLLANWDRPGRQQKDTTFGAAAKRRVIILARYTLGFKVQRISMFVFGVWGGMGAMKNWSKESGSKIFDFQTLIVYNCFYIIWILRSKWCLKI